ncbi:methylase of polypeptide subunit release factors [Actinomadura coerulea]|uniref:Methylase of polypeptide subunit release factors n=1 Tax=Actinomadura coerulea TaxID=46159 RepID=A0A7X0G5J9_9ACTN|nr:class I SAM-dependent methyltransferase [Actinomadura coerulea]MBB6399127.1 methylase of polypeptide subunit release factors [Actinomadura coerulea]GGQ23589.1 transferase [Actinomadura coerulea]
MPDLRHVRELLLGAGYTVAGVRETLGPVAGGALARDEIVPALRATAGGSPVEVLTRLFWLQVPVPEDAVAAGELVAAGLAEASGGQVRPLLRVEPLEAVDGDGHAGYAVSDLKVRPGDGRVPADDHVVGTGGASGNLARLVVHRPVDNVLDLGTGCGVQAVHVAGRSPGARITATDVNPRALELAGMSFALSGVEGAELLRGSLLEPVEGRRFDLIVSNPPFVVAPPGDRRFTYRESGMAGDDFCRRLVGSASRYLNDGGYCQLLANWLHVDGVPWEERVGAWVDGCDAWIVQRDVQDPAEYAELWLRDSCEAGTPEYRARYEAWLDEFERRDVTGIGFGWITLRRGETPAVRIEELRHAVEQPVGAYAHEVLDGLAKAEEFSTACGRPLAAAPGLVQEQIGPPGAEDPERIVLRQADRLRRAAGVGTVEAALAGVCDGTLPLDPLLDAIAQLTGMDPGEVRAHAAAVLPELIADGFFV